MSEEPEKLVLAEGDHLRLVRRRGWEFAERLNLSGIVAILALTEEGRLVLTEQYREPVQQRVVELPAGLAGDDDSTEDESLVEAARRELLEETGYEAARFVHLAEGPPSAGLSTEIIAFFHAQELRRVTSGGGVGRELIDVHEVPLATVEAWLGRKVAEGVLIDPKVYTGLYFARRLDAGG